MKQLSLAMSYLICSLTQTVFGGAVLKDSNVAVPEEDAAIIWVKGKFNSVTEFKIQAH